MPNATGRRAFFVSDRTGITAEMLGHSLLSQFEGVPFREVTLPFVETLAVDKPWRVGANGVCEGGQVRVGNAYGSRTLDVAAPFCDPVVRP